MVKIAVGAVIGSLPVQCTTVYTVSASFCDNSDFRVKNYPKIGVWHLKNVDVFTAIVHTCNTQ